jgi:hypothetical protein
MIVFLLIKPKGIKAMHAQADLQRYVQTHHFHYIIFYPPLGDRDCQSAGLQPTLLQSVRLNSALALASLRARTSKGNYPIIIATHLHTRPKN